MPSLFHLPPELLSSTSPSLFNPCSFKRTISSINREVGFIARTLGRLRHKQHLSQFISQCSPDPQTPPQEQDPVSFVINRVLGRNVAKEPIEDLESAPASPVPSSRSSCSDDDDEWSWPTPSLQTSWPELQNNEWKQPPPPFHVPAWEEPEDIVHVTVDARCPTTFTVPSSTINSPSTSPCTSPTASTTSLVDPFITATTTTDSPKPTINRHNRATSLPTTLFLPDTSAAQFHDFARWLRTSRILPYTPQGSDAPQWAVEDAARRLRDAFRLAYELGCEDYGKAAVAEFKELGECGRGALGW